MRALIKTRAEPGAVELIDWPEPEATAGTVVVEVRRGGVCSTDVMIHDWTYRGRHPIVPPAMLGHEATGVVTAVGEDVGDVAIGNRVSFQVIWGRPHAPQTMMGYENLDPKWFHFGASAIGGAFATRVRMQADRVILLPESVGEEDAVLLEPLAVALHTVELTRLAPGDSFLVIGPGAFGQLMCQIASVSGAAHVIAVGVEGTDEQRLALAAENGATHTISYDGDIAAVVARVQEITGREGADAIVDGGGTADSTAIALEAAAPGGRVALFGFTREASFEPFRQVIRKGLVLSGVSVALRRHYGAAVRLIETGQVKPSRVVTHRLPIDRFGDAVELMRTREATKVLLSMEALQG
jgi:2-desacetyl-2-hydroxyethyl bacteriochlorophyllide A dehydrogenase